MRKDIKRQEVTANHKGQFDKESKLVFDNLKKVVDCVAQVFGSNCEVVLHSLKDPGHSVIKIANGHVTGRKVGSPLTDFSIDILRKAKSSGKDIIRSYFNRLDDGTPLKSADVVIKDDQGNPIGLLCINIDLSIPLFDFIRELMAKGRQFSEEVVERFPSHPNDLVLRMLEVVTVRVNSQRETSSSDRNKEIVIELYKSRIFDVRGAIDIIAKKIGISRYTVYNYIREAKVTSVEEE